MKYIVIHNACGTRIGEIESPSRPLPELWCKECGRPRPMKVTDTHDVTIRRKPEGSDVPNQNDQA